MATPGWSAEDQYQNIFQKFRMGIEAWCRTGKEPKAGNQDMKYYLDLQEKRLKTHGLTMELDLQPEQEIMSIHKIPSLMPSLGSAPSRFDKSLYAQYITKTAVFSREGKKLLRQKDYLCMYQTILDPAPGERHLGSTTYVCPNCGSISTLSVLQETGCPFCGTRYLMKDLYPKVTNFYYIDTGSRSEKHINGHIKLLVLAAACGSFAQAVYTVLTDPEFTMLEAVFGFALGVAIWMFCLYLFYSMGVLVWALVKAGKTIPLVSATAGSKSKITRKLKQYDPAFDYEYFEGKALAFARILMLSERPEECAQYEGPALGDSFSDVVDIQYRGGIGVRGVQNHQGKIEVNLDLFLSNTLDRGGRLVQKNEKIRLSMYHNAAFPVDGAFSIVKVQCNSCGGSFDARTRKTCPYCNQKYDAGIHDWIVTKISR